MLPRPPEFQGLLLEPGDPHYHSARRVWNGEIDRRPAAIARCKTVADVAPLVRLARERGLLLAVRGGGHGVAGHAVCDGGLVIDLSPLRGVTVDAGARRATVQPGATWGDLDGATAAHGLATTGGMISTTGVAGLTLGGGIGWLMREHGLTCDNLLEAELIDCEGRTRLASAEQDPELFWGLRGGGGNFGVVTRFVFQLQPVDGVLGGMLLYPLERGAEVLDAYRALTGAAPDALTTVLAFLTAPPAPFVPAGLQGRKAVAVLVCHAGELADGEGALAPLRALRPAADAVAPIRYVDLQRMLDAGAAAGQHHRWRSDHLRSLDVAGDRLLALAAEMPGPFAQLHVHHLEGAVARVDEEATAYPNRRARFAVNSLATWAEPAAAPEHLAWAARAAAALAEVGEGSAYVNFLDADQLARAPRSYGERTWGRLRALKARLDPDNLFRCNANIPPAA